MRNSHRRFKWIVVALAASIGAAPAIAVADPWKHESGHHRHHKHKHKHKHHRGPHYHPALPPVVYYEAPRYYQPPPVYYAPQPGVSLNLNVPLR